MEKKIVKHNKRQTIKKLIKPHKEAQEQVNLYQGESANYKCTTK